MVLDVNDESPEFQFAVYKGQIEENLPPGNSVLHVKAVDDDEQDMVRHFDGKYFLKQGNLISLLPILYSRHKMLEKFYSSTESTFLFRLDFV